MARSSQFTEEFKREAVRKAEASQNVSRTARDLGISNKTLHQWINQFGQPEVLDVNTATMGELSKRIRELERTVAQKEATIQVLKKLSRLSARKSRAIYRDGTGTRKSCRWGIVPGTGRVGERVLRLA